MPNTNAKVAPVTALVGDYAKGQFFINEVTAGVGACERWLELERGHIDAVLAACRSD